MPPHVSYRSMGELLEELDKRAEVLSALMPHGQTLLFDWQVDQRAPDGTDVGCFHNAFTRRKLFVARDGRVFVRTRGLLAPSPDPSATVRAALPTLRDWVWLGGYAAGDLLGPRARDGAPAF